MSNDRSAAAWAALFAERTDAKVDTASKHPTKPGP